MRRWILCFACALALLGCRDAPRDMLSGYAEAEYVRVAAPVGGTVLQLSVARGDTVKAGAPLFVLEQDSERAAREEAQARVATAQAQLDNLRTGRRPEEIAAVRAQLAQAQAALSLSQANLERQEQLVARQFASPAVLDEASSAARRDRARVAELAAQLDVARLAARPDELRAAEQAVTAARQALAQVQWRLDQKSQRAPVDALVQDTLFRPGEWVAAGVPVVSLLPPANIKLRFFVPEPMLGRISIGQRIGATCDGCAAPIEAAISYIAPQAEYTPPVIYSRENRAKLVFMVEARPNPVDAMRLHPGQPVDVRLEGVAGKSP
ncbi:MAG: HlyD family efflux transporter periplasmic adaptor subunit [Sterolibacteriaceae bacterium]|nr:HlyD family efflux transporter periplasmic adaptor subunit [Sterolibacteriaceae bacterium]MBK9083945.1 HlyD family efflux transporter periplasmic adaptor subunit [Sterolibacteriaceae bacterium]